jgi:hypothetical protein
MKHILATLFVTTAIAAAAAPATPAQPTTHAAAFEKIKGLAGTWSGPVMPGMGKLRTSYRVIAAGSAVLETCFTGTKNEMVSVYHLDSRGRLIMTHYCMMGNQPECMLDLSKSTASDLKFKFTGGENIRKTGMHMRGMNIRLVGKNKMECGCESYKDGKSGGSHTSTLVRVK